MENFTARKVIRNAKKYILLYQKVLEKIKEMNFGDLYYWKKEGRLLKVLSINTRKRSVMDPDLVGRIEVITLASDRVNDGNPLDQPLPSRIIGDYSVVYCVEWEKISVKDLPLHINAQYKAKEFYRLLAKGD